MTGVGQNESPSPTYPSNFWAHPVPAHSLAHVRLLDCHYDFLTAEGNGESLPIQESYYTIRTSKTCLVEPGLRI